MGDLDDLSSLGVPAGHQQPAGGQPLGQLPPSVTEIVPGGDASGGPTAVGQADELDEQPAGGSLVVREVVASPHLLCEPGQRPRNTAEGVVGVVGEPAVDLPLPQQREGQAEQGQGTRVGADVGADALGQALLEPDTGAGHRPGHDLAELLSGHRSERVHRLPKRRAEPWAAQGDV